jgi:hypothetical protein
MKNNEEFRTSVFAKAAKYEETRKAKKQKQRRSACALALCAACCIPLAVASVGYGISNTEAPMNVTTAASTLASTTVAVPGVVETMPESLYVHNGAYTYITGDTLYEHRFISFGINEYTAKYFDEDFYKENVVMILLINVEAGEKPLFTGMDAFGRNEFCVHINMEQDENQSYAGTAVMLIPVPRESVLPIDAVIDVVITE